MFGGHDHPPSHQHPDSSKCVAANALLQRIIDHKREDANNSPGTLRRRMTRVGTVLVARFGGVSRVGRVVRINSRGPGARVVKAWQPLVKRLLEQREALLQRRIRLVLGALWLIRCQNHVLAVDSTRILFGLVSSELRQKELERGESLQQARRVHPGNRPVRTAGRPLAYRCTRGSRPARAPGSPRRTPSRGRTRRW
jgi:hypothetical protein